MVDDELRFPFDSPLADATDEPFSLTIYGDGQDGDVPPTRKVCARCGGSEFHIATARFLTAIRCVECRWEAIEHQG